MFHVAFNPPKKEGVCDKCGSELYQRDDDSETTIRERLGVYNSQTSPLIDYYEGATESAQKAALAALVAYYNKQPEEIQKAMLAWLKRRQRDMADKLLIKHLTGRLVPPAPTPTTPEPAPPVPPTP